MWALILDHGYGIARMMVIIVCPSGLNYNVVVRVLVSCSSAKVTLRVTLHGG